jgi:hypothetical protein
MRRKELDDDPARHGVPLFCSERKNADGTAARVGNEALRAGLAEPPPGICRSGRAS